jgi:hypothetical protein
MKNFFIALSSRRFLLPSDVLSTSRGVVKERAGYAQDTRGGIFFTSEAVSKPTGFWNKRKQSGKTAKRAPPVLFLEQCL